VNNSLRQLVASGDHFQGYAYAYPHKSAYRRLEPTVPLSTAWGSEDKSALFLYAHVPFCEMRCGFCNLFTTTHPGAGLVAHYLEAIERQAESVATALGPAARCARVAIGGGTPTFLQLPELERLFEIIGAHFPGVNSPIPKAIEASPATVDQAKLDLLAARGVTRVSLGVQSFIETETRALGRPQRTAEVRRALGLLAAKAFPCLNIDLIYGAPGQTPLTWQRSLEETLEFAPQEIYLYPLYVRPLTGLDRVGCSPADDRIELYRFGRDFLLRRGYRQISMRLFRARSYAPPEGPVYCCQEDGMVGLGAGARSYTTALHYSTEYAVGAAGVQAILQHFIKRTAEDFSEADYGCSLDATEQRRRYVLKSLLRSDGLDLEAYRARFGSDPMCDLPELTELSELDLVSRENPLQLNGRGLELSDVIGPWLCSPAMREKMSQFALT
jgi:oxygen-independent coproporphyrinogen-3 oxidase